MPQTNPVILIFEQHSFTSGSEVAEKLIIENWCDVVGFELPNTWDQLAIKSHYEQVKGTTNINNNASASHLLTAALNQNSQANNFRSILSIRSYFTSNARLKLLTEINDYDARAMGLDISMKEREELSGHITSDSPESKLARVMLQKDSRNRCIANSIVNTSHRPMVCILGILHAHDVIGRLHSMGVKFISCFVHESWAPKEMVDTTNDEYPPEVRRADGILEFSSVDSAICELRKLLLPYSLLSSKALDIPTSLTSDLSDRSDLSFFSICSKAYRVSAIAEISGSEDEAKATRLQYQLKNGCFFQSNNKRYFGLPSINMPRSSDLPGKIDQFCRRPS